MTSDYHDAHLDDDAEWDAASTEDVTPRPSGMAVFSLRLPQSEIRLLKRVADERRISVSDVVRGALRSYRNPQPTVSLSASSTGPLLLTTQHPVWMGGLAAPSRVEIVSVKSCGWQ